MKPLIALAFVAIIAVAGADDDYDKPYSVSSYSAPSYSSPSYSAPAYKAPSYSAPTYTQKVLVYPPPQYETVKYAGYTRAGKKGKKTVPVYKTVDKY
ncbi:hypothetical protein GHT06_007617 [Daphnia sinensis]|uniref:Uncharacterized protein n=1 Tax=Daphnia sinensis TaxID=1820382 RepID=A0AAD5KFE8_9CRUS|nr:hypothetical protein GHT06_005225 [Daphnia sinensis]KAI9550027.1 hypothetical protein GHT06_007617 [Daphnia sinensis]